MYDTFGSSCACNVTVRKNASLVYNDAYMARVLVPAFMHEAVSLVDEYSLARAKRMAHSSNMDLDGYAVFFFFIFFSVFACSRQAHGAFEQHGFRHAHGLLALVEKCKSTDTCGGAAAGDSRARRADVGWLASGSARYSVYLLYWYRSTNTDADGAARGGTTN